MLNVKTSVLYKIVKTIYTHTHMYLHIYLIALNVMIIAHLFLLFHACIFIYKFLLFLIKFLFTLSGALNIAINNQLKIIEFIV